MTKIIREYSEYGIDEYPKSCIKCPFFKMYQELDMGAVISYFSCDLGYSDRHSISDRIEFMTQGYFKHKRWYDCKIEENPSIYLEEE